MAANSPKFGQPPRAWALAQACELVRLHGPPGCPQPGCEPPRRRPAAGGRCGMEQEVPEPLVLAVSLLAEQVTHHRLQQACACTGRCWGSPAERARGQPGVAAACASGAIVRGCRYLLCIIIPEGDAGGCCCWGPATEAEGACWPSPMPLLLETSRSARSARACRGSTRPTRSTSCRTCGVGAPAARGWGAHQGGGACGASAPVELPAGVRFVTLCLRRVVLYLHVARATGG